MPRFYALCSQPFAIFSNPAEALNEWKKMKEAGVVMTIQTLQSNSPTIECVNRPVCTDEEAEQFSKSVVIPYRKEELKRIIENAQKELDTLKK